MHKTFQTPLILASASLRRVDLLNQINVSPTQIIPADINETALKSEKPKDLALRLSLEKAQHIANTHHNSFILAADTVVACGRTILDKAETKADARLFLQKLSHRRHQVHGGITLITPSGKIISRACETLVQFKHLSNQDINAYIDSNEWEGKAGGYAIQGFAATFIKYMAGSYSNVVGLSLYDTMTILKSGGYIYSP